MPPPPQTGHTKPPASQGPAAPAAPLWAGLGSTQLTQGCTQRDSHCSSRRLMGRDIRRSVFITIQAGGNQLSVRGVWLTSLGGAGEAAGENGRGRGPVPPS